MKMGLEEIVVLSIVGIVVLTGLGVIKNPLGSVGNQQSTTTIPNVLNNCATAPSLNIQARWYNASFNAGNGGFSYVATTYNTYPLGQSGAVQQGSTSAGGATNNAIGIQCGKQFLVATGDWGASAMVYYMNASTVNVTNVGGGTTVYVNSPRYSAPTLGFKNATTSGFSAINGQVRSIANGQQTTGLNLQISVTAGQGYFGYPGTGSCILFSYNTTIVSQMNGLSTTAGTSLPQCNIGSLPVQSTYSGDTSIAFQLPALVNFQQLTLSPSFTIGSASNYNTPNVFSSTQNAVGVYLISSTNWVYNGALLTGVYYKPGTSGNPAAVPVTSNSVGIGFTRAP